MTRTRFSLGRACWLAAAVLAVAATALAQQPQPQQRPQPPRRDAPRATQQQPLQGQQRVTANKPAVQQGQSADYTIAQLLAIDNQEEIELARLAASKTKDEKVRKFAEALMKDHDGMLAQLHPFAGGQIARLNDAGRRAFSNAPRDGQTSTSRQALDDRGRPDRPAQPGQQPAQVLGHAPGGPLDIVEIRRQVAQICLDDANRKWDERQGAEADMAYLGGQVAAHAQMIACQKVLRQYASPQLQETIDKGIETAQAHLDQAKELIRSPQRQEAATDAERKSENDNDSGRDRK